MRFDRRAPGPGAVALAFGLALARVTAGLGLDGHRDLRGGKEGQSCSPGSIIGPEGGGEAGGRARRATLDSQRQIAQPPATNAAMPSARCRPWWLSSGDSRPATSELSTSWKNACSEEAAPRWRGYMSRIARVSTGNTRATPKANRLIGSTAHGTAIGGASTL